LNVLPEKHFINWQQDPQSNYLARLVFQERTREFCVEVDLVAEMAVYNPFDFFLEPEAEKFPFVYADILESRTGAVSAGRQHPPQSSPNISKKSPTKSSGLGRSHGRCATAHDRFPGQPESTCLERYWVSHPT